MMGLGDEEMGGEPVPAKKLVKSHRDLEVYQVAFDVAMKIFEITKVFPREETYSLTDQIRRSSRSVCANLAEAWRKRRYEAAFISKLSDSETEAAETQVWIKFAVKCKYLSAEQAREFYKSYEQIIGKIVRMENQSASWVTKKSL